MKWVTGLMIVLLTMLEALLMGCAAAPTSTPSLTAQPTSTQSGHHEEKAIEFLFPFTQTYPHPTNPRTTTSRTGYINSQGKVVIPPRFDSAGFFHGGMAPARLNGVRGFVNTRGEFFPTPNPDDYESLGHYSEGFVVATVQRHGPIQSFFDAYDFGYLDLEGKLAIPARFDDARSFSEGLAAANKGATGGARDDPSGGKWGYIDKQGEWVIEPQFAGAGDFFEGLARVEQDDRWGYIDKQGNWVIEPQFDWMPGNFSEGKAAVRHDGLYGYIDREGEWVIQPRFARAHDFSEGLAVVAEQESQPPGEQKTFFYINEQGEQAFEGRFTAAGDFHEGLASASKIGMGGLRGWEHRPWGYIGKQGRYVIEPKFNKAGDFVGGVAEVEEIERRGYINRKGEYLWFEGQTLWPGPAEGAVGGKGVGSNPVRHADCIVLACGCWAMR